MNEFESLETMNKISDIIKQEKLIALHNDLRDVLSHLHYKYTDLIELNTLLLEIRKIRIQMDICGYK